MVDPIEPPSETIDGRCIVVFNTKGGVGKTVVAVNLAVSLAQRTHAPVCLVDLDVTGTGDVARMLGLTLKQSLADVSTQLAGSETEGRFAIGSVAVQHESGVTVVQATQDPRQAQKLTRDVLRPFFNLLKSQYAYVVVDTKVLSDHLISACDASNLILFVTTPDVVSLYQTKRAMDLLESFLFPPQLMKGVLNRAQSRGGVGSQDARMAMPCEIIAELPSDGRAMGFAVNQGTPVVSLYGLSKISEGFKKLADTLVNGPALFLAHLEVTRGAAGTPVDELTTQLLGEESLDIGEESGQREDEIVNLKRRVHERLVQELNLKKVDVDALNNPTQMKEMRRRCEQAIAKLLSQETGGLVATHEMRVRLVKEISDEALGLGPLEELMRDPTVSDILVNGKDQIFVEQKGKLHLTDKRFITDDQVRAIIERIVAPLGRRIDESTPMVDARLPDGSRVNAIIPPLSLRGPVLSIRRFASIRFGEDELVGLGSLNKDMVGFIRASVMIRKNVIVSGGTGSGKTTLLNLVSAFIPDGERIITIEDAAELRLKQFHLVTLEARPPNVEGKGQVSIRDLFRNALRMRPDRIIIGECRGAETLDMLQAMNTGHDGSLTTVHANSPKDVASRLDSMVLMSNIDLPIHAIREMVASAIDLVVHTARMPDGSRKVTSICELVGLGKESEIRFRELFRYDQSGVTPEGKVIGEFMATGEVPSYVNEFQVKGVPVDAAIFKKTDGHLSAERGDGTLSHSRGQDK
ncbi:MAG TPA: ATPase, T2SS/T4P/T4SS family [bacterium]